MRIFETYADFKEWCPNGIVPSKDPCFIKETNTLIYHERNAEGNFQWYWGGSADNTDPETPVTPPSRPEENTPIETPEEEIQWKWFSDRYDSELPYRTESNGVVTYRLRRTYYYWYSYNGTDWFKSNLIAKQDSIDKTVTHTEPDETFIMNGKLHRVWYYWYLGNDNTEVKTDEIWKSDDVEITEETEPTDPSPSDNPEDVVEISEVYNLPADEFGYWRVRYFIVNGVLTDQEYARAYKNYSLSTLKTPDEKTAAKGGYNEVYYYYATHYDNTVVKTSRISKVVFVDTTATKEYTVDAVNGHYTYTRTYYTNYKGNIVVLEETPRVFVSSANITLDTSKSASWFETSGAPSTETDISHSHPIEGTFHKTSETDTYVEYTSSSIEPWSFAQFKCVGFDVLKWAVKAGNGKYISATSYLSQLENLSCNFDSNGILHDQKGVIKKNDGSFVSVSHNTKSANAYYIRVGCNCKSAVIRIYKKP